ncbi:MAG TPA: hypothetical protein VF331_13160 [Polyangiales bacterium]
MLTRPHTLLLFLIALPAGVLACSQRPAAAPSAAPPPAPARVAYGSVMADVARRFELLGRAASARRYELADYELGELGEQFQDALPHAAPPKEGHPDVLPRLAEAFLRTNLADLARALAAREPAGVTSAFERTATACNECHHASGHPFIEVPTTPGRSIPNTDPTAP